MDSANESSGPKGNSNLVNNWSWELRAFRLYGHFTNPRSKWHSASKSNHAQPGQIATTTLTANPHTTRPRATPIVKQVYPLRTATLATPSTTENPQEILLTIPESSTTVPIYVTRGAAPQRTRATIPIYLDLHSSESESIIVIRRTRAPPPQLAEPRRARIIRVPFLPRSEPPKLAVKKSTPSKRNSNSEPKGAEIKNSHGPTTTTANVTANIRPTARAVPEKHVPPPTANSTLASMAGIQLTGDDYQDQSPAMSGAMQPPTATVEEIDVAVFIDEYLQQLNPTASTAPPTNHNTNNFNNHQQQFNANGDKEEGQQQHPGNIDDTTVSDNASFETLEFDIDMIGHENILVRGSEGQLQQLQQQESEYYYPASNSNIISNHPIEAQFHIVPFSSEPCLSQSSISQYDLYDELRTEEAIDISSFNNENIPLTCNNDPLLSSAWQSTLEPYNGKLDLEDTNDMYTLSEEPCILYEEGESSCGDTIDSAQNTQLQSMEVDTEQAAAAVVVHAITVPAAEPKPQSQNFFNDLITYYQPDTPQSPPSCMTPSPSPSPSSTSISPKSRTINRPARRASATKKALLNLNIPFNTPTMQQAVQTPDILETLLADPKLLSNEAHPHQTIQQLIEFLQVPEASDANTTKHNSSSSSSSNSSRISGEYILGEYIPNQSDSNVSSPKSFAESYDDQPYTPQSHTSNTTYTTAADYQPYSPALSVSSCTQSSVTNITTKARKRGRPAKEHSDQPDEKELAKLPEVEQKRLLNRAKNNEASRLSRERAKRKESEVAAMEMQLAEENKQLLERYAELEHLEARYKRELMSH